MGLDRHGLTSLLSARRKGVSFKKTALSGRQHLLLGAKDLFLFEKRPLARWYKVADPQVVGERVIFSNALSDCLLVMARKVSSAPVFARYPELSDYVRGWRMPTRPRVLRGALILRLRKLFPAGLVWGQKVNTLLRSFPARFFRRRKRWSP